MLRLVGDRALAEDLTQEVFLRVFQGLPSFSLRCRFTTWLFQVTKNRVLDELRALRAPAARGRRRSTTCRRSRSLDAPFERVEAIDAVWRAVENLNVDLKMALLLRDVVGLSYTEIADSLEITLATVKWRIYKAREEVQLALAREGITFGTDAAGAGLSAGLARPADRGARSPYAWRPRSRPPSAASLSELARHHVLRGGAAGSAAPTRRARGPRRAARCLFSVPSTSQWPTSPASAIVRNSKPSSASAASSR